MGPATGDIYNRCQFCGGAESFLTSEEDEKGFLPSEEDEKDFAEIGMS